MEDIVIRDRSGARVLAVLPAVVVVLAVRLLTLGQPPVAVRAGAAAGIALAGWVAYRLLTARLVVAEDGLHVRGVFYVGDVSWAELDEISRAPSGLPLRLLVWGVFSPETLTLRAAGRRLRPVAAISGADDDELRRAMREVQTRLTGWSAQVRRTEDSTGAR
jgi:hypothetical protein